MECRNWKMLPYLQGSYSRNSEYILLYFYVVIAFVFAFLFLSFSVDLIFQRSLRLTEKLSGKCKNFPYIPPPLLQSTPIVSVATRAARIWQGMSLHWRFTSLLFLLRIHCKSSCYTFITNLKICYFKFLYIIYDGVYIIHKLLQF